jgi:glutamate racemase
MVTGTSTTDAPEGAAQAGARSQAPIGVFDSGVGGLSVLRELVRRLPEERFVYVADSAHCPYGGKTTAEIIARAVAITDFLLACGAKLIVVACNTATIAAVEYLRANYSVCFVGMEPAVKPAVALTRSGVIGILATAATLAGEKLQRLIERNKGPVRVLTQPAPGLPERVEAGELQTLQTRRLVERYTAPLLAAGADVIVLGSTHYPFLRPLIGSVVGPEVRLLDTGEAVARRVEAVLEQEGLRRRAGPGALEFFTSGSVAHFTQIGGRLWDAPLAARALPESAKL